MAKMSDKTKRAINRGRRKAGLPAIKFGSKHTKTMLKAGAKYTKVPKAISTAKIARHLGKDGLKKLLDDIRVQRKL